MDKGKPILDLLVKVSFLKRELAQAWEDMGNVIFPFEEGKRGVPRAPYPLLKPQEQPQQFDPTLQATRTVRR